MKLKDFLTLKVGSGVLVSGTRYSPYINYSWSQPLTVGGNQQIKDTGTAGLNLQQFFGQGCWFNGIDQNIVLETVAPVETSPIWTICFNVNTASTNKYIIRTIGGVLKVLWFNGGLTYYNGSANIKLDTTNSNRAGSYVVKSDGSNIYTYLNNILISTIPQTVGQLSFGLIKDLAGYSSGSSYLGVLKDVYLFKKSLSETEINNYFNQPNQFFMDSLEDSSCILAMPMCEKNNLVRNYKNNTNYPITNYLTTCRTNAQRLSYGLQTSGFKRDNNGLILSKSNFLEADGVGYGNTGWIPENGQEFTIEWIYANPINGVDAVLEGIGIEINNNADLYLRQLRTTGKINVKFGANSIDISSVTFKMIYLAVTVTSGNFTIYVNSINRGTSSNTYNRTLNALNRTFFLGGVNRGSIEKIMTKESKLFKVHQKALSQEEVTQNFNKYQAQGLLNE